MAIIQALIALIGRSVSRVLNAVFGWAVRALFGRTSATEETLLSGVVAVAALWPLLFAGIFAPRLAAYLLAFIPIPKSVPDTTIRAIWIALAVAVPAILGLFLAAKVPPGSPPESFLVRVARGYPTTLGIAVAFCISFVSVPVLRLASALRGTTDTYVPLITDAGGLAEVAERVQHVLNTRGYGLAPQQPGFWLRTPIQVMRALGGAALRNYVPEQAVYLRGPDVEVELSPASLLLRGPAKKTVFAHGLVVETLTAGPAFQTTDPGAQDIERQIHRVWRLIAENPDAHRRSPWLRGRVRDITDDLTALAEASYDDWQTVYRQVLQLARALDGAPQLLAQRNEDTMDDATQYQPHAAHEESAVRQLSTVDLLSEISSKAILLINKETALARSEMKAQLQDVLTMVKGLAVAAVAALLTLNLLLMAAVFALAAYMTPVTAALCLAAVTVVIAGCSFAVGWRKHIRQALPLTRRTLREDLQWAKEELA